MKIIDKATKKIIESMIETDLAQAYKLYANSLIDSKFDVADKKKLFSLIARMIVIASQGYLEYFPTDTEPIKNIVSNLISFSSAVGKDAKILRDKVIPLMLKSTSKQIDFSDMEEAEEIESEIQFTVNFTNALESIESAVVMLEDPNDPYDLYSAITSLVKCSGGSIDEYTQRITNADMHEKFKSLLKTLI